MVAKHQRSADDLLLLLSIQDWIIDQFILIAVIMYSITQPKAATDPKKKTICFRCNSSNSSDQS